MKGKRLLPIDPRPSRADPEARRIRKEMEKEHSYEWVPPIVLGLIGITLAWDVSQDVSKCEERKEKEEKERESKDEERKRRKREKDIRRPRKHGDGRYDAARAEGEDADDDGYSYDERRRVRRRSADTGLDRADRLERGDGEGRDRRADEYRKRRSVPHDDYYDYDPKFSREQADDGHDYGYDRRGRTYDDRRSRPRPRRQSSDW